jgi:hypothetical protein
MIRLSLLVVLSEDMSREDGGAFGPNDRPVDVACPEKLEQQSALDRDGSKEGEETAIAQSTVDRESEVERPTQERELQTDDDDADSRTKLACPVAELVNALGSRFEAVFRIPGPDFNVSRHRRTSWKSDPEDLHRRVVSIRT